MRVKFYFPFDIIICIVWSLVLLPIALLESDAIIRIILGLPVVLFIPGYVLVFALFPKKKTDDGIDSIERIALSFGLSLAVVPLIGLGLNYTTWGIRLVPILAFLTIFIILFAVIGIYRWLHIPLEKRFIINMEVHIFEKEKPLDKALTLVLTISIIISASLLIYVIITPKTGEHFTEFYILGPTGIADNYPNDLFIGENTSVIIGVANHEYKPMNYTIEIWLINQTFLTNESTNESEILYHNMWFMDSINVSLNHVPIDIESNWTAQWEYEYTFSIKRNGSYKLLFLLFDETAESTYIKGIDYVELAEIITRTAYRSLHLWLDII